MCIYTHKQGFFSSEFFSFLFLFLLKYNIHTENAHVLRVQLDEFSQLERAHGPSAQIKKLYVISITALSCTLPVTSAPPAPYNLNTDF